MGVHEPTSMTADRSVLSRTTHPGILLVSSSLHVIYMNPEARTLLSRLALPELPPGHLPAVVRSFCQDLLESLSLTLRPLDWEHLHLARISDTPSSSILLRGFGVPDPHMKEVDGCFSSLSPFNQSPRPSMHPVRRTPYASPLAKNQSSATSRRALRIKRSLTA